MDSNFKTLNITLEIESIQVLNFENWLRNNLKVIDFKILPDTKELYQNDEHYQKLVKAVKKAQEVRDRYINEKK
jgi:uncharacterized protein (DUF1330 family)